MSIMSQEAKKQNGCVLHWTGAVASANSPKAITANGDVKQLLPFPGAGIGMFDGTGDYVEVAGWYPAGHANMFDGNFTIECFASFSKLSVDNVIVSQYYSASDYWALSRGPNPATLILFGKSGGSTRFDYSCPFTPTLGRLYHIVVERSGSSCLIFIDGMSQSVTAAVAWKTTPNIPAVLRIGRSNFAHFNGTISELRISKGIARYTSNFTPPRKQLESDSYTTILQHFLANGTTFIDSSSYASSYTVTANGDAKQLCSPCGSGVAYFDGTGDYLTIADSSVLELGAGNWTIQGRIYLSTIGRRNGIICKNDTTARYPALMLEINASNRLALTMSSNGSSNDIANAVEGTTTIFVANTWYDIKIIRDGTSIIVYVNGTTEISITSSATPVDSSYAWGIGCVATDGTGSLLGYISEFEYASTTRPLTIATRPFKPDPYTKLLLHMDGVGNAFYDSSDPPGDNGFPILPDGVTVTPTGTFAVEKMKDGRNIWKFDGSTNYITISDHASWSMFLNDFTIAGWVKFDSVAENKVIIGQYTDANNQWYLQWTTGNIIQLYGITSSTARFDFSCPLAAVANTWYHIVVQRSGSSCIMYINGVAQTVTQTTAFSATATDIAAVLSIGKINTGYQTGNIKDLQMFTKALTMDQISALYQETFIY